MWDAQTLQKINEKAAELAREGKPERDALKEVGITLPNEQEQKEAA